MFVLLNSVRVLSGSLPVGSNGAEAQAPPALADHVAKLVLNTLGSLTDGLTSTYARRKVLAGIVMTRGEALESSQVLCVTTGTKCINGEYLSDRGTALNDCHAEVIARRCLRRFFYEQLLLHLNPQTADQSVFRSRDDGNGFKLKDEVQFHLYISTSPCGDARIFSPHEKSQDGGTEEGVDSHPNRKARGQLRTKIESGEGTIPVQSNPGVQTWDGVMQGERLLTMSCSDKIARWNVLGVQGTIKVLRNP